MATSEDELQKMAYQLNLIARKFKMTISSTKTKSMAMCGNVQRVKIVRDDKIIEQVTEFKYLGYCIVLYCIVLYTRIQK
jgi:Asp-tRNA(Asn)/Glu-tRNA(Gln) amidotransferase C subunit